MLRVKLWRSGGTGGFGEGERGKWKWKEGRIELGMKRGGREGDQGMQICKWTRLGPKMGEGEQSCFNYCFLGWRESLLPATSRCDICCNDTTKEQLQEEGRGRCQQIVTNRTKIQTGFLLLLLL